MILYNFNGNPTEIKGCIDCLSEHWQFEALKLLEGNQRATESFRNGMCEEVDGKVHPKPNPATLTLVSMLQRAREDMQLIESVGGVKLFVKSG